MLSHGCCFFFFKQKPAYEMRISDWSSDVCSSDLARFLQVDLAYQPACDFVGNPMVARHFEDGLALSLQGGQAQFPFGRVGLAQLPRFFLAGIRSEERRVGKGCVSTCRSRGTPSH